MSTACSVRAAGPEAAALLGALHAEALAAEAPGGDRPWDEKAFAALLAVPGRQALVVHDQQTPLGLLLLSVIADEAEVLTLAVLAHARRRGCGRALIAAACTAAVQAGAARLLLEVAEDNAPARTLYAATGFITIARRRSYYARAGGAMDALVLARPLTPCGEA